MATGFSDDLRVKLINATLRNTAYTSLATVYISLHTADPLRTGASEVPSSLAYARVSVSTTGGFDAPGATNGTTQNTSTITFPTASGSWGTAAYVGIWSAASGGVFLYGGALTVSKAIGNGDTASFAAGALSLVLA